MTRHQYYSVTCSLIFGIIGIVFCENEARMNKSITSILEYLQIDPDTVSEYKLVEIDLPERVHKRDLSDAIPINIEAFGDKYELVLQPRDSVLASNETGVYIARYVPGHVNDVRYERVENPWEGVGIIYEDPKNMASMIFHSAQSGRRTMNGNWRSQSDNRLVVIRPMPQYIIDESKGSQNENLNYNDHNAHLTNHMLLKLKDNGLENYVVDDINGPQPPTGFGPLIDEVNYPPYINGNNRIIDTVYPEILLHIHSSISDSWSWNRLRGFLEYILTFWNGVDLIYRDVEYPKVRLNIAVIVIAAVPQATPYIWHNTYEENGSLYEIENALASAALFYHSVDQMFRNAGFDVAITMSKLLGSIQNGPRKLLGRAFQTSACSRNHVEKKHWGAGLIHDKGGYWGISHAAHELGHLLGLQHEDDATHTDCPLQAGFVMDADFQFSVNVARLSICSRNDLRKSFEGGHLQCMFNKPWTTGTILPGTIAGKAIDKEEQCRAFGDGALCIYFQNTADPCTLWCESKANKTICNKYEFAIPQGTSCEMPNGAGPGVCYQNSCTRVG